MRWFAILLAIGACGRDASTTFDPTRGAGVFESIALPDAPPGLSDLALDGKGVPWTIAERDRFLVEITLVDASHASTKRYPITGIPDGVDAESLAWLGPDKVAIGLEWQDEGKAAVAFAARTGDAFSVSSIAPLTAADVGVAMKKNHGAEGICGTDGDLVVAIEETGTLPGGGRYAPIVRITGETKSIYRLHLGSATGKISALACTIGKTGIAATTTHVLAIERHYGVSRIVRFDLPPAPAETPLEETLVVDLAPILKDSLNLEGIVLFADGRMLAISDNQSKTVSGPGYVLVFPAR